MQINELRKDLRFNTELRNLVETLKNVAGSQYQLLEKKKERFEEFMDEFAGFFRVVDLARETNPLIRTETDILGLVIVTSDSGFMGGLNAGVIDAAIAAQGRHPDEKTKLVVIGDKGTMRVGDMNREYKFFPGIHQDTIYEQSIEIKDYIVNEVLEGRMGKVILAYPKSISFTAQSIEVINILPCGEFFDRDAESEVSRHTATKRLIADATRVIVESTFADMAKYLAGVWVSSKLFEVFEDSKLAEFSARAMHLEDSLQKVEKEQKKLKHLFFKASHEQIDKGMREGFSAKNLKDRKKKAAA
jgi:ATP synthase F1 gamma subunit